MQQVIQRMAVCVVKKYLIIASLAYLVNVAIVEASAVFSASSADQQRVDTDVQLQYYTACSRFETAHLELRSIFSADQDIACYMGYQPHWCKKVRSWAVKSFKSVPFRIRAGFSHVQPQQNMFPLG